MIKILDRYIILKYLRTFFFSLLIFSAIAVTIDFSQKVEQFIEHPVTKWQIISEYYFNFIPWINGILVPIYALIAVIFITSRMAGNSEIISMLSAGMPFRRILIPFLVGAGIVAGAHLVANHLFIPRGNKTLKHFENNYISSRNVKSNSRNVHMFIDPNNKIFVKYYRSMDTTGTGFRLETFENERLVKVMKAKSISWIGRPNKWSIRNYEVRELGDKEIIRDFSGQSMDTTLNLTPEDFVRLTNQKEMMTTPELREHIEVERRKGLATTRAYEIEIHRRSAEPFTAIILTFLGVVIAARKVRGGVGLHLATGIGIGAIFIFLSKFSISFALSESIHPALGVWIPNLIFLGIGFILFRKAQR